MLRTNLSQSAQSSPDFKPGISADVIKDFETKIAAIEEAVKPHGHPRQFIRTFKEKLNDLKNPELQAQNARKVLKEMQLQIQSLQGVSIRKDKTLVLEHLSSEQIDARLTADQIAIIVKYTGKTRDELFESQPAALSSKDIARAYLFKKDSAHYQILQAMLAKIGEEIGKLSASKAQHVAQSAASSASDVSESRCSSPDLSSLQSVSPASVSSEESETAAEEALAQKHKTELSAVNEQLRLYTQLYNELDKDFYDKLNTKREEIDKELIVKQAELAAVADKAHQFESKAADLQERLETIQNELSEQINKNAFTTDSRKAEVFFAEQENLRKMIAELEHQKAEDLETIASLMPVAGEVEAAMVRIKELEQEKLELYGKHRWLDGQRQLAETKATTIEVAVRASVKNDLVELGKATKENERLQRRIKTLEMESKEEVSTRFKIVRKSQAIQRAAALEDLRIRSEQEGMTDSIRKQLHDGYMDLVGFWTDINEDEVTKFNNMADAYDNKKTKVQPVKEEKVELQQDLQASKEKIDILKKALAQSNTQLQYANSQLAYMQQQEIQKQAKEKISWGKYLGALCLIGVGLFLVGAAIATGIGAPLAILGLSFTFGGVFGSSIAMGVGAIAAILGFDRIQDPASNNHDAQQKAVSSKGSSSHALISAGIKPDSDVNIPVEMDQKAVPAARPRGAVQITRSQSVSNLSTFFKESVGVQQPAQSSSSVVESLDLASPTVKVKLR